MNLLTQAIAQSFALSDIKAPHKRQKPYFIKELFHNLVHKPVVLPTPPTPRRWQRLVIYPLAFILILGSFLIWHHSYRQNIAALALMKIQLTRPTQKALWLSSLDQLQNTLETLKNIILMIIIGSDFSKE